MRMIADTFTMVVAHELFDAIPIHIIEVSAYRDQTRAFLPRGLENRARFPGGSC